MKTIVIILLFTGTSLFCHAQSTPEYKYAVLRISGHDWDIYYEDSIRHFDIRVGWDSEEYHDKVFKMLHYLNQQGYELVSYGSAAYYFKGPMRK